ncbi:MAG: M18 family aminopeptidase [Candidatus Cloacimonetes bacterium]|jgi:aspartyl aminopeptidase|nr:M18 family aminopeptidase [Candidatus Cloacimonadota bacterium]
MHKNIKDLLDFLTKGNSRYPASREISKRLDAAGFIELNEAHGFTLKKGEKYYIRRMDTAIIAFVMGSKKLADSGFYMASSHIDSPALKLKPESLKTDNDVCRIGVEVYGGPIVHTWLDRELGISGRVIVKNKKAYESHTIDLKQPLAIIPNAAIHINREINKGFEYNKQTHLQAVLSVNPHENNPLKALMAKHLKVKDADVLEMDLYLYDYQAPCLIGLDEEMIASGRLDNLAMTHAILTGLIDSSKPAHTSVGVFFDHEEIGSQSPQGAFSSLLSEVLERIALSQSNSREDYYRALRNSFMISADMAHAYHPSYSEKYDEDYSPKMNRGPVIKRNVNLRYASTADSSLRFMDLCAKAKVQHQEFLVRSDMPCGSTVGPVVAANLGISIVDIGNPMWAMHSVRETAGVKDHMDLIAVLKTYFSGN